MAEKLLKVKGVFDPGDVQTGLQALTANMRDMGKAALEVGGSKDAWAALGQSIEKMRPDLANVATVAYETAKAMDGIGRSGANFTQIEAGVSKASGYLKILKDAMQEAEKAGVDIGPKVKASIETMEQGIAGAAAKAKVLRESFSQVIPPEAPKAVDALARALENLDKAAESPRRLGSAAAIAKVELDEMREAAEAAGTVTAEMGARFDQAEAKIKAASDRAAKFRDTAGDLATQGNLSAKSFEAAASSAGSLDGMLGHLKDTGSATQGKIADMGFAAIGLGAAFKAGLETGKMFDEGLKSVGLDLARLGEGGKGVVGMLANFGTSLGKVIPIGETNRKLLKDLAKATSEFSDVLGPLPTRINPVLAALHANQRAASEAADGAKKYGIVLIEASDQASKLAAAGKEVEKFFDAHGKGKNKLMDLNDAIKANTPALLAYKDEWIASGRAIEDLPPKMKKLIEAADAVAEGQERQVEAMKAAKQATQDIVDAEAKKQIAEDDAIDRLKDLADRTAKGTASTEDLQKAIAALAEKYKVNVSVIQELMKAHDGARAAREKEVKSLAELADKYQQGRATGDELRGAIEKIAEKMGIEAKALADLVERRRQDLELMKEQRPVYENAAEVNEQYADSIKELVQQMEDLAAAREKEHKAMYEAAQAEADARAKSADKGGGPIAWLKDIDEAKEKVEDLGKSIESLGDSWIVAGKAVLVYQGQLREASAESMKLDESTQGFIDKLLKIAGLNDKNSSWIKQYIEELERSMQLSGKSYEEISVAIDQFIDKVRGAHRWMEDMNTEFVLGGQMYGDIARQMGQLATATDEFKRSLIGK